MKPSLVLATVFLLAPFALAAQAPGGAQSPERQARSQAALLDGEGKGAEARVIWQRMIDEAPDPAARAAAHRRMAMSYGFEADCANAIRHHEQVIAYWVTREAEEPQNAFYQQGEMANESARVCIDGGDLDEGERMYRRGSELGNREPEPRTHSAGLWSYRLAHALGRIAARRGDAAEAMRQVAEARRIVTTDTSLPEGQERFLPQLEGYVAFYTGDVAGAERILTAALEDRGNQRDPFMLTLLGEVHERLGQAEQARELFTRALEQARGGHNPPAAYANRVARAKLGG